MEQVNRRSFLWGIVIAPWLVKPLRAMQFPVKSSLAACYFMRSLPEGIWQHVEILWTNDSGKSWAEIMEGRPVDCRINGERIARRYWSGYASVAKGTLPMRGYSKEAVDVTDHSL